MAAPPPLPGAITNYRHTTWAHTFSSRPGFLLAPTTESQLRSAVRLARTSRRRICVVGAGHSPSYMTCTSSWLVTLRHLNRIVSADGETGIVVVQAGITLRDLNASLERHHGLTLPTLGSIDEQSIAGAISTGTHGSSLHHGLLSGCVQELRLVLGNGDTVTCRRDAHNDQERELFRAATLSLGAMGVIVELTLRAVPACCIRWSQTIQSDVEMLSAWEAGSLWGKAEFVRVWWLPHTRRALVWSGDRAARETREEVPPTRWPAASHRFHALLHWLSHYLPRFQPWVEWLLFGMQFGFRNGTRSTGVQRSSQALLVDCLYSQTVNEWAVPLSKGPEALRRLSAIIDSSNPIPSPPDQEPKPRPPSRIPIHTPIEVRVAAPTPSPPSHLDPSCRYQPTVFFNVVCYRPRGLEPTFAETWYDAFEGVMRDLGGRPHWAKNFGQDAHDVAEMYGDDVRRWKDVRHRVDPDGVFVGPWLREKVLGWEDGEERLDCEEVEMGRVPDKSDRSVMVQGKVGK